MLPVNSVNNMEMLEFLKSLDDESVDMILSDPPYASTSIAWDKKIDLPAMWEQMRRVIKPKGAIVLTAANPFASDLIQAARDIFRYEWIWEKSRPFGFVNAKSQPMRSHENVLVFSLSIHVMGFSADRVMNYYPQMAPGKPYVRKHTGNSGAIHYNNTGAVRSESVNDGWRYPQTIIRFPNPNNNTIHPTQKPVDLFDYLIRTYTLPGELVVDPFVGSGTTAVAARGLNRNFIVNDLGLEWVEATNNRLNEPYSLRLMEVESVAE